MYWNIVLVFFFCFVFLVCFFLRRKGGYLFQIQKGNENPFWLLFYYTVAGVLPCGGRIGINYIDYQVPSPAPSPHWEKWSGYAQLSALTISTPIQLRLSTEKKKTS